MAAKRPFYACWLNTCVKLVPLQPKHIESTFSKYPLLAKLVVKMFYTKFEPGTKDVDKKLEALHTRINTELDNVANLDDDRIIRRYVELIDAALRTNFFQ